MIGYHYTSYRRWQEIQKTGLIPQLIYNAELIQYLDKDNTHGVWLWKEKLTPRNELGIVLFELCHRAATDIVCLRVEYRAEQTLFGGLTNVTIRHTALLEKFECYFDNPQSIVLTQSINPDNIELEKRFNVMDVVKEKHEYTSQKEEQPRPVRD